jgi:HlyD family secretion protein
MQFLPNPSKPSKPSKPSAVKSNLLDNQTTDSPAPKSKKNNSSSVQPLQLWIDSFLHRLLSPRRRGRQSSLVVGDLTGIQSAQRNLVGDGDKDVKSLPAHDAGNPFHRQADDGTVDSPVAWEFKRPVLLNSTHRVSSFLVWTAFGLTTAGVLWIFLAPLSENVQVRGRLQPGSKVKPIINELPGRVDKVLVKEGQLVKKGQPLVVFDVREPRIVLSVAEDQIKQLSNENKLYSASLGEGKATGLTTNQQRQLRSQSDDLFNRRRAADEEIAKSKVTIRGLKVQYELALDVYQRFQRLAEIGAGSTVQALDYKTKAEQLRAEIASQERDYQRLISQRISAGANPDAEIRSRIEANIKSISEQQKLGRQARLQIQNSTLTSPTDGIVFNVSVQPGSMSNPLSDPTPLLTIVPADNLTARVFVPNNSIGFVVPGQHAQISIDSYPSAYFGHVSAQVTRVGSDAVPPQEVTEVLGSQTEGLFFPATLKLDKQFLEHQGTKIPLLTGMSVSADVRLQMRTMAQIIFKWGHDNFRSVERIRSSGG